MASLIKDIKGNFDARLEELKEDLLRQLRRQIKEDEVKKEQDSKLRLFMDIGLDISMRNLEDMTLRKMRDHNTVSESDNYESQVDEFDRRFHSTLSSSALDHLRHSRYRDRANDKAHQHRKSESARNNVDKLLKYLNENGPVSQRKLVEEYTNFLWGKDEIRRKR